MAEAGTHLTSLWPDVEWGQLEVRLPDLTFGAGLVLYTGGTRVELLHLGPAHTAGDLVAWLPDQHVLFTGDLVMSGVTPFCPMGSVSGSLAALQILRELGPRVVVPGHGPLTGPQVFDETEGYLRRLQLLAKEGVAAGITPVVFARDTDLGPYSDWLDSERLVPNLHRACAEERGAAPGTAVDMNRLFADMVEFHGRMPACHA
jgi:cyclase